MMQNYGNYPGYPNMNVRPRSTARVSRGNPPIMPSVRGRLPVPQPAFHGQQPAMYPNAFYPPYPAYSPQAVPAPAMYPGAANAQFPQAPLYYFNPNVHPGGNPLMPVTNVATKNDVARNMSSNPEIYDQMKKTQSKVRISKVYRIHTSAPEDHEEYLNEVVEQPPLPPPPPRPESPDSSCSRCSRSSNSSCSECYRDRRKHTSDDCAECRAQAKTARRSRRHRHH